MVTKEIVSVRSHVSMSLRHAPEGVCRNHVYPHVVQHFAAGREDDIQLSCFCFIFSQANMMHIYANKQFEL